VLHRPLSSTRFPYTTLFRSNGLRLTLNANILDATTVVTKGADWNTPWENRSLGSTFATGRRYGDIYGFVTDRLYQKEDFVYDARSEEHTSELQSREYLVCRL